MELELQKKELPLLKEENIQLRTKIKMMENNCDIIKWYLEVMEEGVDTKDVIK